MTYGHSPPSVKGIRSGDLEVLPHCNEAECLQRAAQLLRVAMTEAPAAHGAISPRAPKLWLAEPLADFVIEHCRGTGRTYEWIIEHFTEGQVTLTKDAAAYHRAMGALYAQMPRARHAAKRRGYVITSEKKPTGRFTNGRPICVKVLLAKKM